MIPREVKETLRGQQALVDEIVEHSRLARESQEEAKAARGLVFALAFLVEQLRSHIAAVTDQRDRLIEQLHDQSTPEAEGAELRRRLAQTQEEVVLANRLHQQSKQELSEVREQLRAAEALASDAQRRLVAYQSTPGVEQPQIEDYRRLLEDLTHDREEHQQRIHQIKRDLNDLPGASPPPTTAGSTASITLAAPPTKLVRSAGPNGTDQVGAVVTPVRQEVIEPQREPPAASPRSPAPPVATTRAEEPGAAHDASGKLRRWLIVGLLTPLLLMFALGSGALAWYGAVDVPLRYSLGDRPRGGSLSDGFEWKIPAGGRIATVWRGFPTREVLGFSGHLIFDGDDRCRQAPIAWTLLVNDAEVAGGTLRYTSHGRAAEYLIGVEFKEYLQESGPNVPPTRVELRAHRLDKATCQSRLTWDRAGFDARGPGRHPWDSRLGADWANLLAQRFEW